MDERSNQLSKVRALIVNARREINKDNPIRAREQIKPVYQDSNDLEGTVEWADLALTMAETFLAESKPEAESYFAGSFLSH
jgi:hypothetical protein